MSELEQLQQRIDASMTDGVETAAIRDDYDPAGDLMIHSLISSGDYVTRKTPAQSYDQKWRIFKAGMEPY